MSKVETIKFRPYETGKGTHGWLPERPIELRPGDKAFRRTRGNTRFIEIHRASFLKRLWLTIVRGS